MNRTWLRWLPPLLGMLIVAGILFAEDRHYIPIGNGATDLFLCVMAAIIFAVQARRKGLPEVPTYLRRLPLGRFILIGTGMIAASLAWFAFGLFSELPPTATVLPFLIMLTAGLAIFLGCAGLKFYKMISRGL